MDSRVRLGGGTPATPHGHVRTHLRDAQPCVVAVRRRRDSRHVVPVHGAARLIEHEKSQAREIAPPVQTAAAFNAIRTLQ